eukprot:1162002-Pelagomonas_calceolata.AAC.8
MEDVLGKALRRGLLLAMGRAYERWVAVRDVHVFFHVVDIDFQESSGGRTGWTPEVRDTSDPARWSNTQLHTSTRTDTCRNLEKLFCSSILRHCPGATSNKPQERLAVLSRQMTAGNTGGAGSVWGLLPQDPQEPTGTTGTEEAMQVQEFLTVCLKPYSAPCMFMSRSTHSRPHDMPFIKPQLLAWTKADASATCTVFHNVLVIVAAVQPKLVEIRYPK